MAKITEMPGEKIIGGFKGVIDFYYWRGIACVRRWPRSPGHRRAPAVEAAWTPFINAVHLWDSLAPIIRDAYEAMATTTTLSRRDWFIRSYIKGTFHYPTGIPGG